MSSASHACAHGRQKPYPHTAQSVDCDTAERQISAAMARLRPKPRSLSRRKIALNSAEFSSLKEVRNKPPQRTIPDEHRDRLHAAGYVREVAQHVGNVSALTLTGAGIRRLDAGE